jgi:hypothetical protein
VALPDAIGRLQALVMEALPGTLLSRDNLDSMRVDSVATGTLPTLQDLGIRTSSVTAVAPTYLAPAGSQTESLDAWRKRH